MFTRVKRARMKSDYGVRHQRQIETNLRAWTERDNVAHYAHNRLLPVEALILARYHDRLSGRVLELGCGAGRILGYLVRLGGQVEGIDVSERMVAYCREHFPGATVRLGDLRDTPRLVEGKLDAILLLDNVLDVLDDAVRRQFLSEVKDLLADDGVLIFSSHNLVPNGGPSVDVPRLARRVLQKPPAEILASAGRVLREARNRRRLAPLQYRAADHAVLNDSACEFAVLHYYTTRDDQERQLNESGLELVECLDVDGDPVPRGERGQSLWLHYVARARPERE